MSPEKKIINFAAHAQLVSGTRRSDHITPAIETLRGRKIPELVHCRDCINVHRALHDPNAPAALRDLFTTRAEQSQRQT